MSSGCWAFVEYDVPAPWTARQASLWAWRACAARLVWCRSPRGRLAERPASAPAVVLPRGWPGGRQLSWGCQCGLAGCWAAGALLLLPGSKRAALGTPAAMQWRVWDCKSFRLFLPDRASAAATCLLGRACRSASCLSKTRILQPALKHSLLASCSCVGPPRQLLPDSSAITLALLTQEMRLQRWIDGLDCRVLCRWLADLLTCWRDDHLPQSERLGIA